MSSMLDTVSETLLVAQISDCEEVAIGFCFK